MISKVDEFIAAHNDITNHGIESRNTGKLTVCCGITANTLGQIYDLKASIYKGLETALDGAREENGSYKHYSI